MRPNRGNLLGGKRPELPVSQGAREPRGRRLGACALERCGRGGAGGGARVGVPAEAAGGDGAVRGGEGQPGHAAGGGERSGARPAPVRGVGRKPASWSAECWRTGALRELQGRVSRRLLVQGTRGVSLLQREASACDGNAPGGAGVAACAYRQWTLSLPHRVRWVLLKDVGLLLDVLTLFLRAGARPAATEGTAAGPTWWAGCCRVIHPVLRLRLAGDSSFPLAGAGRRFRAAGRRRALRAVASAHASRGGATAAGGAALGAAPAGEKRGPARARARGRAADIPGALPAAAAALDGGGCAAPFTATNEVATGCAQRTLPKELPVPNFLAVSVGCRDCVTVHIRRWDAGPQTVRIPAEVPLIA
jgi:hypothetical protein